ncbi:hypothetical protein LQ948_08085 [Jiella sp. MQZ9-1]|uniref:Uncharacterized protein n=1 Tax=Jiella flava TaxID=2816857 RepID=A0A939FWG5_9HYPH|nr:hypothetical protein [Jiella flava]MBO0662745.1 hypothetical protein [Jiella flava]MCD2471167.1 hypothetical protein [Jiella flava]
MGVVLAAQAVAGCSSASGTANALDLAARPQAAEARPVAATGTREQLVSSGIDMSSDMAGDDAAFRTAGIGVSGRSPSPAEIDYARATAASLFRRRKAERAKTFLPAGLVTGYGLCLRAPDRKGSGYDYILILMPHRLRGGAISQVDDDTLVMRRPADTEPCRGAPLAWVIAS